MPDACTAVSYSFQPEPQSMVPVAVLYLEARLHVAVLVDRGRCSLTTGCDFLPYEMNRINKPFFTGSLVVTKMLITSLRARLGAALDYLLGMVSTKH